jgi:hypothetical protein
MANGFSENTKNFDKKNFRRKNQADLPESSMIDC